MSTETKAQITTGIRNFIQNIKPIMERCKKGQRLTPIEQGSIVQFYLETIHVVEGLSHLEATAPAMLEALKAVRQAYDIKDVVKALDALGGLTPLIDQAITQAEGHTE